MGTSLNWISKAIPYGNNQTTWDERKEWYAANTKLYIAHGSSWTANNICVPCVDYDPNTYSGADVYYLYGVAGRVFKDIAKRPLFYISGEKSSSNPTMYIRLFGTTNTDRSMSLSGSPYYHYYETDKFEIFLINGNSDPYTGNGVAFIRAKDLSFWIMTPMSSSYKDYGGIIYNDSFYKSGVYSDLNKNYTNGEIMRKLYLNGFDLNFYKLETNNLELFKQFTVGGEKFIYVYPTIAIKV